MNAGAWCTSPALVTSTAPSPPIFTMHHSVAVLGRLSTVSAAARGSVLPVTSTASSCGGSKTRHGSHYQQHATPGKHAGPAPQGRACPADITAVTLYRLAARTHFCHEHHMGRVQQGVQGMPPAASLHGECTGPCGSESRRDSKHAGTTAQLGGGCMHCLSACRRARQQGRATASCRRPVCVPGGWRWPHTPGSKQMAAPASLAVCTADLTRSSGSSSNTNPLVNTAAVDCSACTRAHTHASNMGVGAACRGGWRGGRLWCWLVLARARHAEATGHQTGQVCKVTGSRVQAQPCW